MKKEKLLFDLPSLTSLEGKPVSLNSIEDLGDEFDCSSGCQKGCSDGTGTSNAAA